MFVKRPRGQSHAETLSAKQPRTTKYSDQVTKLFAQEEKVFRYHQLNSSTVFKLKRQSGQIDCAEAAVAHITWPQTQHINGHLYTARVEFQDDKEIANSRPPPTATAQGIYNLFV